MTGTTWLILLLAVGSFAKSLSLNPSYIMIHDEHYVCAIKATAYDAYARTRESALCHTANVQMTRHRSYSLTRSFNCKLQQPRECRDQMYSRQLASSTAVTPTHEISAKTSPSVVCHTHNSLFAPLAERHQDEIVTDGRGRRVIHLRKSRPSLPLFLGDGTRRRVPTVEGN